MRLFGLFACGLTASALGLGAVSAAEAPAVPAAYAKAGDISDPLRPANKAIFRLNEQVLDPYIFEPVVKIHNKTVPRPARVSIRHFLFNLTEPVTFENSLLQGNLPRAANSTGRFAINTTVGLLGIMDIAADWGLEPNKEDFGQTLGRWGVGQGPYLVLPVLGASSARDVTGRVVDALMDPFSLITFQGDTYVSAGKKMLDELEERAHEVKSDMRTGVYADMSLDQHYDRDRQEFRLEQIAEVGNRSPVVVAAQADQSPFATGRPVATVVQDPVSTDPTLLPLQASLNRIGLELAAIDRAGGELTVTLDVRGEAAPLACARIWADLSRETFPAVKRLTVTTPSRAGPVYSCTRII